MTEETKAKRQEPLERGTEEDCPQRALESLSTYEMGAVLSFPKVTEREGQFPGPIFIRDLQEIPRRYGLLTFHSQ